MFYRSTDLGQSGCQIDLARAVTMIKYVPATSPIRDTPFSQLADLFTTLPFCVLSIERNGWPETVTQEACLEEGDVVALMYNQQDYGRIIEIFGFSEIQILKGMDPEDFEVLQKFASVLMLQPS